MASSHRSSFALAALALLAACVRQAPPAPVIQGQSARPAPTIATTAPAPVIVEQTEILAPAAPTPPPAPILAVPLPPPAAPIPAPSPPIRTGTSMPRPPLPLPDRVTVRPGETLYAIARRYDVPVRALIDANGLKPPYSLAVGGSLTIPKLRQHVVQPGETLYSVSRLFGVDVTTLARANDIAPPYTVRVGQPLILPIAPALLVAAEEPRPPPPPEIEPAAGPPPRQAVAALPPPPAPAGRGRGFIWPVRGRLIAAYGTGDNGMHNDGINIAAPAGSAVVAADDGVVAYAGNELRGYGNLVLIKHRGGWMTAYAHNSKLLVKRGDKVRRGQPIARVGRTGAVSAPQLHFEIRHGSKALDPGEFLPPARATAVDG